MRDADTAGCGLLAGGLLLLVFFVPIVVFAGGLLGVLWEAPLLAVLIAGIFFVAWRVDRAQKARRRPPDG